MISYTDAGEGKAIMFIHAFPTDQRLWEAQKNELKNHFRVVTLDLWGFGASTATDGRARTMSDYAAQVNELLVKLHIDSAIIAGESMGGYIALAFLEHYPQQVDGLILSNTQSIADNEEAKKKREQTAVDVLTNGSTQFVEGFLLKALSPNATEQTKNTLKDIATSQTPTGIASALRGMALREETTHLFAKTEVPILFITSDNDLVIPSQRTREMQALARNSKLVVIPGAGHLTSLEQPKQWNQAVMDFFLAH